MRLINMKVINRSDLSALNYIGFEELFIQMSIFMHSRLPNQLSHLPPVVSIASLVHKLEEATERRNESLILFEDPDASALGDRELVKELNKTIEARPDYPLPEGYKKISQREIVYQYVIPSEWGLEEGRHICLELLDEICSHVIGFHFIEPMVEYKNITRVQPTLIKPKKSAIPLRYMDALQKEPRKKNKLEPINKPKGTKNYWEEDKETVPPRNKQPPPRQPKVPPTLKVLVAGYPKDQREDTQEVAITLDQICTAVSKGEKHIKGKWFASGGNQNLAQRERKEEEEENRIALVKKEEYRKKRAEKLKKEVKKNEEIRAEQKVLKEDQDRKRKIRDTKKEQRKKAEYEKVKQENIEKIQASKTTNLAEEELKRDNEARKQREDEEKKNKKHKEFINKQRTELVYNIYI